jgi:hypothetical protein
MSRRGKPKRLIPRAWLSLRECCGGPPYVTYSLKATGPTMAFPDVHAISIFPSSHFDCEHSNYREADQQMTGSAQTDVCVRQFMTPIPLHE